MYRKRKLPTRLKYTIFNFKWNERLSTTAINQVIEMKFVNINVQNHYLRAY